MSNVLRILLVVVASHGLSAAQQPASADRITVNVHHDAEDAANPKCRPYASGGICRDDAHWHISVKGRRYDVTKEGCAKFGEALAELGKGELEDPLKGISARQLLIRADRNAPYGYVCAVMKQAAAARIFKIEVGAGVPRGTVAESPATRPDRVESRAREPLPPQTSNVFHTMKLVLRWRERGGVERRIGDSPPIPEGPQGDAMIEDAVWTELMRRRPAGVTLTIAADPGVPWKAVLGVFDIAREVGADRVEFSFGDEPESRAADSRPTSRK